MALGPSREQREEITGTHSRHRVFPVKSKALTYACQRRPAVQPRGHSSELCGVPGVEGNWRTPRPLGTEGSVVALLTCPQDCEILGAWMNLPMLSFRAWTAMCPTGGYFLPFSTLHVRALAKQRLQSILGHLPIRKGRGPLGGSSLWLCDFGQACLLLVQVESGVQGQSFGHFS